MRSCSSQLKPVETGDYRNHAGGHAAGGMTHLKLEPGSLTQVTKINELDSTPTDKDDLSDIAVVHPF